MLDASPDICVQKHLRPPFLIIIVMINSAADQLISVKPAGRLPFIFKTDEGRLLSMESALARLK